jgi:DNA-binding NtrC family response regulator
MMRARILIVDDDKNICSVLSLIMKKEGFTALVAHDGETALKVLRAEKPHALLLDVKMPGMGGIELLKRAKKLEPKLPIIMITAYAGINGAVEAMRCGAHNYLAKPFENREVVRAIHHALGVGRLDQKRRPISSNSTNGCSLRETMGPSEKVAQIISGVSRVANSDFSVLLLGETGSGKELVARAIHQASHRSAAPFVPVDCGAIPETLLESELFGHEKGAFTSAEHQKIGKFEAAQGGTLFLDEISNTPLTSQAKLLRALQEKAVCRLGSTKPVEIDVRLLVASNQDLLDYIGLIPTRPLLSVE